MRAAATAALVAWIASTTACAHDVVLPDAEVSDHCGDGVVGPTEECDEDSPGCTDCKATPGYECDGTACYLPCGDGIEGDGPHCASPHKTAACDMTGYWVMRETDYTRDEVVGAVLTSSTWYVYRFVQEGDAFHVEEVLHCGVHVTGPVTVDYTQGTAQALIYANDQSPSGAHGPRRGTFQKSGAGCAFAFDRWYGVRGGEDALLPNDFGAHPSLASLPALPVVPDPVHPPGGAIDGATDPDGDGLPGAAYRLTGFVGGTRNSVQRDFKEYASLANQPIASGSVTFEVPGRFDLEESILSVTDCDACDLIASRAYVDPTLVPKITLRFLGATTDGRGVASVVEGEPRSDVDADLTTCANARAVLPHEAAP